MFGPVTKFRPKIFSVRSGLCPVRPSGPKVRAVLLHRGHRRRPGRVPPSAFDGNQVLTHAIDTGTGARGRRRPRSCVAFSFFLVFSQTENRKNKRAGVRSDNRGAIHDLPLAAVSFYVAIIMRPWHAAVGLFSTVPFPFIQRSRYRKDEKYGLRSDSHPTTNEIDASSASTMSTNRTRLHVNLDPLITEV